jgi:hypothetical protein
MKLFEKINSEKVEKTIIQKQIKEELFCLSYVN